LPSQRAVLAHDAQMDRASAPSIIATAFGKP
jgi:hypothetical protein